MSAHEIIGVTVVGTQHHHIRTLVDQRTQQLIVLGGTTLADDNIHTGSDARTTLVQRRTLMVGGDAGGSIAVTILSCHSRGVTVHGFAIVQGRPYLRHHLFVAIQHTGIVHHLAQETDILTGHQRLRILGVNHRPAGLCVAAYCRHTAGCTEQEVEACLLARTYHVVDTRNAQHVANLVRVGNDTYRTVTDGNACKLMRHYHTTLNMHVGINETWHDVGPRGLTLGQLTALYFRYDPILNDQFAIVYLAAHHINYMSFYILHSLTPSPCRS